MSDDYPTDNDWEQVMRGLRGTTSGLEHERDAFLSILTDLIAELREGHPAHGDRPPLWARDAAGRAEARLREVFGDE